MAVINYYWQLCFFFMSSAPNFISDKIWILFNNRVFSTTWCCELRLRPPTKKKISWVPSEYLLYLLFLYWFECFIALRLLFIIKPYLILCFLLSYYLGFRQVSFYMTTSVATHLAKQVFPTCRQVKSLSLPFVLFSSA